MSMGRAAIRSWPCPAPGGVADEFALAFDGGRRARVLVVPALFDEGNRMRRLHGAGVDTFLPDLPGCNESVRGLDGVTLEDWRAAVRGAARHFGASHVLAVRGGVLVCEGVDLPLLAYAPVAGASVLRQMLRMRVLAAREAGREESAAALLEAAKTRGIVLAGYALCAAMVTGLQEAEPGEATVIAQGDIGGAGLWLRAEPDEDAFQVVALANRVAAECGV